MKTQKLYRLEIKEVLKDLKEKKIIISLYLTEDEVFEIEEKLRKMKRL